MNTTIRTYETRSNTYHIVKTAKTSYEQQQEIKANRIYIIQKLLIIIGLILAFAISGFISLELIIPVGITCLLGVAAVLTNNL